MSDNELDENAAFAERIARPLRDAERLPEDFESRLLAAARAESRANVSRPTLREWWSRPRWSLSPAAGLALAAGFAGLVAVGTLGLANIVRTTEPAAVTTQAAAPVARDTVTLVRFVFVDPSAKAVSLVGDFNKWTPGETTLRPGARPGVWSVMLPLSAGRHEYAFIVDGKRWVADPLAAPASDEFGTESSVVHVGSSAAVSSS